MKSSQQYTSQKVSPEMTVGDISEWPRVQLSQLKAYVKIAKDSGQHLFVWDQSGEVSVYFENFGTHLEFTCDMVKVALA